MCFIASWLCSSHWPSLQTKNLFNRWLPVSLLYGYCWWHAIKIHLLARGDPKAENCGSRLTSSLCSQVFKTRSTDFLSNCFYMMIWVGFVQAICRFLSGQLLHVTCTAAPNFIFNPGWPNPSFSGLENWLPYRAKKYASFLFSGF